MQIQFWYINIPIILIVLIILGVGVFLYSRKDDVNTNFEADTLSNLSTENDLSNENVEGDGLKEFQFESSGLRTNTAKTSIPLEKVLGGGPSSGARPSERTALLFVFLFAILHG